MAGPSSNARGAVGSACVSVAVYCCGNEMKKREFIPLNGPVTPDPRSPLQQHETPPVAGNTQRSAYMRLNAAEKRSHTIIKRFLIQGIMLRHTPR